MAVVTGPTNSTRRIREAIASIPRTLGTKIMNQLQAPDSAVKKVIYGYRTITLFRVHRGGRALS